MASTSVGENQLQRIIRDLRDAVLELSKEHNDCGEPITDDSYNLHKFFYKLEYLLQFDQKEKTTFLGQRKDYWDYFCDCLAKVKGANDGIRFVKSIPELKTSLGKGRAFIRYSLVHQRLADTLQQCLINQKVTSDWYYARSPFLKSHLTTDIVNHLYELNQIQFDLAARGHDLDADWPTFARRTLGSSLPSFLWKPPSRCSSVNSLVSSYSHSQISVVPYSDQAQEFLPVPDHSLCLGELGEPSPCSIVEDLRIELDQSDLRQQQLLARVKELSEEAAELKGVVKNLQGQLLDAQKPPAQLTVCGTCSNPEAVNQESAIHLQTNREAINHELQDRLVAAENKNIELLSKLDGTVNEKGQQMASYCDSAWKIQELLDHLKTAGEERLEAKREAEDRARHSELLSQELKRREEEVRKCEEKLTEIKSVAGKERKEALQRLEDLQAAVDRIQGALTLKEKETGNLRAQLQSLQASLESRERQAEELKRRLLEEREEIEQRCTTSGSQKLVLDSQLKELREHLKTRDQELAKSSEKIRQLQEQLEKLDLDKQCLSTGVTGNSNVANDQSKKLDDYKTQCTNLIELNAKLVQTVRRSEESTRELVESRAALLDQVASLRASEKQLKSRVEAANLTVEDRERNLLEENLKLEEIVQKALIQKENSDARLKNLEHENGELMNAQLSLKKQLDENLTVSQQSQYERQEKLQGAEAKPRDQTIKCDSLQARAEELESKDNEKSAAEATGKTPTLNDGRQSSSMEAKEATSTPVLAEALQDCNLREVSRLQEEVVKLRSQLLVAAEEKMKVQTLQELTETSREDLCVLAEQLKAQGEELNRRHVDEILHSREREEALCRERDCEARARVGLAAEVSARREELLSLQLRHDALSMELSESREALHRANLETAELGMRVCTLTAEKEEAAAEAERLSASTDELLLENRQLLERLRAEQGQSTATALQELQAMLERAQQEARALQESSQEEIQGIRFQLSSQSMSHNNQIQSVNNKLQEVSSQLGAEQQKVVTLEGKVKQLEGDNMSYCQQIEEHSIQMAESEALIQLKEKELNTLKERLSRTELTCEELSENLRKAAKDKQSSALKAAAEIDDLYRTKINLEERLIELIREKDALWQKSDALEFEQKLREEETERDVNYCLGCRSQFSWMLRKYKCRQCGRPFCYYCCSSSTGSILQGGSREHCCKDCYAQHRAGVERHPQEDVASAPSTPFSPLSQPNRSPGKRAGDDNGIKPDDGVFDIITEEEVSVVSDTLSFSTACSAEHGQEGAAQSDTTSEDTEDLSTSVQDAEICLLKAGELTLSVPFTVDDIQEFGDVSRELFIKSSCYSVIPITVGLPGPTVTWEFTSEPKSIAFSVVYRENAETPLEQAKVLIPLTRCNAHKETIRGEMKVRNPGEYTLVFDNSFSRFISKKVLYRLTIESPVVYDGSDCV